MCLFDLIYLVADVWGEGFNQSQVALRWFLLPAVLLERGTETQSLGSFPFSSQQPQCDCGPICSFMCSRPLQRWLSVSVAHSLWNLSCAGDSFHSPAQPKYHVPKMGNATCMQKFQKEKKKNLQQWRVSSVLVSIFHTNMATGYHNKRNRPLMMVFFYRAEGGRCFTGMLKSVEKMLEGMTIVGRQNFPTTPQNKTIRKHLID